MTHRATLTQGQGAAAAPSNSERLHVSFKMVGVNVRGGAEYEHSCVSLTHAGVKICGKTARAIVKFGRSFRRGTSVTKTFKRFRVVSGSLVAVCGSRFVGSGSRAVRGSVDRAPHYRRAERLLRRRSGDMARLPCHND